MATKNNITGDSIQSRLLTDEGRDNWDAIFGKKEKKYAWIEPGEDGEPIETVWSETQILDHYFEWWSEQMTKRDKAHMISRSECISDFCAVHMAVQVK